MQVKDKLIFRLAVVLGLVGLVLGSFGAHGIKFETPKAKELFETGLLYMYVHVPVLMIMGILAIRKEALLMLDGVVTFTVPLILKALVGFQGGIIVPIGGMIMIIAWIWLLIGGGKGVNAEEST